MSISLNATTQHEWKRLRRHLTITYLFVALLLLILSVSGHLRLLNEVGRTFGGFFWATDTDQQIVVVSTPPELPPFTVAPGSLTNNDHLVAVNGSDISHLSSVYAHALPGDLVRYTVEENGKQITVSRPAVIFTSSMWFDNYGWAFIAGICWLVVGGILLMTAPEWSGAVEGITLLPAAMLFLLYSHWGNVQQNYPSDYVLQLLWIPSFALLGAGFIQLSLNYRPEALVRSRDPRMMPDLMPYLPLLALLGFNISMLLIKGAVPTRVEIILSLTYGVIGGILSFIIGLISLLRIARILPGQAIPQHIRRRVGDLLMLWIGGVGLGFCLGILPILLTGKPLVSLQIFYILAAVYPLLLLYAIRSLRLIDRLEVTLAEREQALHEQEKLSEQLQRTNRDLHQATSLLLHADAHLRSLLSQRIHDQPKQQALRIRSLLGHWQQKLRREVEQNPGLSEFAQPLIEAIGKVRKISEELESDLRGIQLLVEDAYQRRNLGLKLHLEKLIREDLPSLHPESLVRIQADLWALDALTPDLEQTEEGSKFAEAISYTVTQALLNIYNHAGANFALVRAVRSNGDLVIVIKDDGHGFDPKTISPDKTSLFKAGLKADEAGGELLIKSLPSSNIEHGTTITLRLPLPPQALLPQNEPLTEPILEGIEDYSGRNPA